MARKVRATGSQGTLFELPSLTDRVVCGLDEAGRGPLAGPVVAAAVILPPGRRSRKLKGLTDSKLIPEEDRERLFDAIMEVALAVGVAEVSHEEIDRVNILRASLLAMSQAASQLTTEAEFYLADGLHVPEVPGRGFAVVGGDLKYNAISAASVIAKVTRDRIMRGHHATYPVYGFNENKGYSTPFHLEALSRHGPCPIHRRTFAPVRNCQMTFL
jgi:ribonuclease HII